MSCSRAAARASRGSPSASTMTSASGYPREPSPRCGCHVHTRALTPPLPPPLSPPRRAPVYAAPPPPSRPRDRLAARTAPPGARAGRAQACRVDGRLHPRFARGDGPDVDLQGGVRRERPTDRPPQVPLLMRVALGVFDLPWRLCSPGDPRGWGRPGAAVRGHAHTTGYLEGRGGARKGQQGCPCEQGCSH
eukprot:5754780-Prymnesium_polylepis.1